MKKQSLKVTESLTGNGSLYGCDWRITRYSDRYVGIIFVSQSWGMQEYAAYEHGKKALETLLNWVERNA
jgi:hypothetical protein